MPFIQDRSPSNALLDGLPNEDRLDIMASCELVQLKHADVICNAGDCIQHVYFPINSIISLVNSVDGNVGMEVALIGNEGMLGITLMLEINVAPFRALVQGDGLALRIAAPVFLDKFEHSPVLQLHLKRYICVRFCQLVQTTVCNRFHVVEARLARLLLMISDRKNSREFHITQELLAQTLGVRRVGVTIAASSLQHKNLISYSRGNLRINDIAGLQASSCICYQTDKDIYNRILHVKETSELV